MQNALHMTPEYFWYLFIPLQWELVQNENPVLSVGQVLKCETTKPQGLRDDQCFFFFSTVISLVSILLIGLHVKMQVTLGSQGLNEE